MKGTELAGGIIASRLAPTFLAWRWLGRVGSLCGRAGASKELKADEFERLVETAVVPAPLHELPEHDTGTDIAASASARLETTRPGTDGELTRREPAVPPVVGDPLSLPAPPSEGRPRAPDAEPLPRALFSDVKRERPRERRDPEQARMPPGVAADWALLPLPGEPTREGLPVERRATAEELLPMGIWVRWQDGVEPRGGHRSIKTCQGSSLQRSQPKLSLAAVASR